MAVFDGSPSWLRTIKPTKTYHVGVYVQPLGACSQGRAFAVSWILGTDATLRNAGVIQRLNLE